jgi:hypothetical protein
MTKNVRPVIAASTFQIVSPAFNHNEKIPAQYTCSGEDVNPPLSIRGIPEGTKTLTLIMDDPDAPMGTWVHWVVYNIPPVEIIAENSAPGQQALNSFGRINYGGPCPPSGTHRYFFKLYALDTALTASPKWTQADVLKAMKGHVLAQTELTGLYKRESY